MSRRMQDLFLQAILAKWPCQQFLNALTFPPESLSILPKWRQRFWRFKTSFYNSLTGEKEWHPCCQKVMHITIVCNITLSLSPFPGCNHYHRQCCTPFSRSHDNNLAVAQCLKVISTCLLLLPCNAGGVSAEVFKSLLSSACVLHEGFEKPTHYAHDWRSVLWTGIWLVIIIICSLSVTITV